MQRLFARTRPDPRAALASTRCKSSLGAAASVRAPEEITKEKEIKNLADAAGPGWWFLFHMVRTDPLSAQTYVYEHYGREHGAVRIRDYFGKQGVVIFDQDDVRHVYQHEGKNPKGTADMPPSIRYWRERGGDTEDNLALNINLTGDRWRKAREALGPGIYTEAVAKYEPFIQEAAREAVRSIKHYETDLSQWAPYASFDMFCALALGKSANTADPSCTSPMREVVDLEAQSIGLALRLTYTPKFSHPRLGYEQMRDGFDRILDIVRPEVHHLFSQEKMPDCWFKDLRDEQGVSIDQLEVVMGFLLSAAIGTTMSTIEWALVALAHFPREQAKVHAEIIATLGGDQPYTKAYKMPQLEAFLREVNRFFPPLSVSGIRKLEHEIVLPTSNVRVPAGATIFLAPLYQARDTHFNSDADQFIPDRYLREKIRERKSCPFSSKLDASVVRNQFGNGSRVCLGKRAAELEVRALVCELLSHYEIVLDPPSQTLPGIAATTVGVPKPFPKLRLLPRKS